ncbi:hypothetical protein F5882DRAFT_469277 [Hyaloscypha sp. PMI_1271]|nr:hypothetical protein F5882DRAFT_469277 [Hyaloscypha sp. PMI_1271]
MGENLSPASLSDTASHDAELEWLSTERETKIAELQTAHENALKELASQRGRGTKAGGTEKEGRGGAGSAETREYDKQRKKWQDCRKKRMINESRRDSIPRGLQEKVEAELERLEDEMERRVEEGKRVLVELDEKRKELSEDAAGEQKDVSNTFIAAAPAVNEPMDIPAEAETKFVGAPKELQN